MNAIHWSRLVLICVALLSAAFTNRDQRETQHPLRRLTVTASDCRFTPATLEANEGDRVRIVFTALDVPHSFVIREYRIARLAAPGRDAVIEFLADKVGVFDFVSDISADAACDMRGQLLVQPSDR